MELRHLRYFVAVAEEENISRAAVRLHVSQPGVSRQIRDLEDELGFLLLERVRRTVRLTAAGKIFFAEACDLLARAQRAVERARARAASQAEINVGYVPTGTAEIMPRALRTFRARFPGVRVTLHDLSVEEMQPLLLQGKLDLALTVRWHKVARQLAVQELARYETRVAVGTPHPLARSKCVELAQIASEPVATYNRKEHPSYHQQIAEMFATVGRKPRVGSEHDSGSSLLAALAAGHEWALLPSCARRVAGARLKLLQVRPVLPPWVIIALWRKDTETEPVRAFVAAAEAATMDEGRKSVKARGKTRRVHEDRRSKRKDAQPA